MTLVIFGDFGCWLALLSRLHLHHIRVNFFPHPTIPLSSVSRYTSLYFFHNIILYTSLPRQSFPWTVLYLYYLAPLHSLGKVRNIMALRLLVNTGLLAIPIGGSVGTLLGIDAHRSATGQPPLFTSDGNSNTGSGSGGDSTGGGSGGSGSTTNNGVTNTQYCQNSYGISPPSDGQLYTRKFDQNSHLPTFTLRPSWRSSYPLCRVILLRADSKLTIVTVNPNQWGVTDTTSGALCMNVSVSWMGFWLLRLRSRLTYILTGDNLQQ